MRVVRELPVVPLCRGRAVLLETPNQHHPCANIAPIARLAPAPSVPTIRSNGIRRPLRPTTAVSKQYVSRGFEPIKRRCLAGGEQGKCHADGRALSWRGNERDPAAELLRHEIMDDVEAEAGTALRTPG